MGRSDIVGRNIETNEVFAYIRYNTLVKAYYGYVPSITKYQVATRIQDLETAMLDVDYFIKINLADECEFLTDEQYKRIELLV
jgi:hypothetical protein